MPLTAQARRLLDRFEEVGVKPYDAMGVLEARAVVAASLPCRVNLRTSITSSRCSRPAAPGTYPPTRGATVSAGRWSEGC